MERRSSVACDMISDMNTISYPLRFDTHFRPMVWGGRAFAGFLGKRLPSADPFGEAWEVSDHARHRSVVATVHLHGMTLRQIMEKHRLALLGPAAGRFAIFPWLVKFLDAADWLSVQVHPDEATVAKLNLQEAPKSEAWLVLTAQPTARIYAGLKPGVDATKFTEALNQGTVADCLHTFTPRPGDFIHLPAGTVHAVGGGILLAEIQQTSDATFRLFDWNRVDTDGQSRTLHLDEGMQAIHWDQGPTEPKQVTWSAETQPLARCPSFEIDAIRHTGDVRLGGGGRLQALIVAEGHGRLDNGEYFLPGDVWILPATMPVQRFHLEATLRGLLCTLP
jgi:mannose-6-phosphate isomerase